MDSKKTILAIQAHPDDAEIFCSGTLALLAQVYRALGKEKERADARQRTLEAIEKRLQTSPNDSRALCFGSVNLLEAGQTEKGLEWLRRAEEGDPDDALNLYNIACVYALKGEH